MKLDQEMEILVTKVLKEIDPFQPNPLPFTLIFVDEKEQALQAHVDLEPVHHLPPSQHEEALKEIFFRVATEAVQKHKVRLQNIYFLSSAMGSETKEGSENLATVQAPDEYSSNEIEFIIISGFSMDEPEYMALSTFTIQRNVFGVISEINQIMLHPRNMSPIMLSWRGLVWNAIRMTQTQHLN